MARCPRIRRDVRRSGCETFAKDKSQVLKKGKEIEMSGCRETKLRVRFGIVLQAASFRNIGEQIDAKW